MNGYKTIHLIHGFNERHEFEFGPLIKRMVPYLRNDYRSGAGDPAPIEYKVHVWDYGHANLIDVRTNNDNYSRLIAGAFEQGDILIGYSNGAAIIQTMLEQLHIKPKQIFLLHPAIEKDWKAPSYVEKVYIFYNKHDKAVQAGKWWRRASRALPWNWTSKNRNHWGELGKTGYMGPYDHRVIQFNTSDTNGMPSAKGHGGLFKAGIVQEWGELIWKLINEEQCND